MHQHSVVQNFGMDYCMVCGTFLYGLWFWAI